MGRQPDEQDGSSSEIPRHEVTIPADFYLGKFEVTKAQWQAVLGTRPWDGGRYVLDDPDSPAVYIPWNDCQSFIAALNRLGRGTFRLPSEAEWITPAGRDAGAVLWGDDPIIRKSETTPGTVVYPGRRET
jgi:formylglycine-generating enzyme required for sulfatase activity